MSVFSNYAANIALNNLFYGKTTFIALHTEDPGVLGDPANEVAGGSYSRQQVTFSNSGSRSTGNTTQANFADMPECVVTHIAVWNAETTGQLLSFREIVNGGGVPTPVPITEGYSFVVPLDSLVVTFT